MISIWNFAEALDDCVNSDAGNEIIPEKYGSKQTWQICEVSLTIIKRNKGLERFLDQRLTLCEKPESKFENAVLIVSKRYIYSVV